MTFLQKLIASIFNADRIRRFFFWTADKKTICGIVVGTLAHSEEHQKIIFGNVEKALLLIQAHDTIRFGQIRRYVKSIFVLGDPSARGYWHQELKMCQLEETFVRGEDSSIAEIASVIVHEATHARLMRLGFGYEEPKRLRIEHICLDAQRSFIRRLPNEDELLNQIEETKSYYDNDHFSVAGRQEAELKALATLGVPQWIIRLLTKLTLLRKSGNVRGKE